MNFMLGVTENETELEAQLSRLRTNIMGDIQLVPGKRYAAMAGHKEIVGIARQSEDGMVTLEVTRANNTPWFIKPDLLSNIVELKEQEEVKERLILGKPKRENFVIKTDKLKMTHGKNVVVKVG